ncbi:MAG: hypothetical protein LBQ98_03810 [Nitrososphaerota archaeon]|jgi:hypothetical protein|nr:hypothetical protein [Nitrososphaerota archaeon]
MNDQELKHRVNQVMYELMTATGVLVLVDVMQKVGVLTRRLMKNGVTVRWIIWGGFVFVI